MVCGLQSRQFLRSVEPWKFKRWMQSKKAQVNAVSCIMYERMHPACQDGNHLHFNYMTDGHCRFKSNMKQDLTCL